MEEGVPRSKPNFPASSELTGFLRHLRSGTRNVARYALRSVPFRLIPYKSEQGNLWRLAGNNIRTVDQGNYRLYQIKEFGFGTIVGDVGGSKNAVSSYRPDDPSFSRYDCLATPHAKPLEK